MGAAFAVALALALMTLVIQGTGPEGVRMGLRVTARWAFLLFWPAYAGGAIATLFGRGFQTLARRGREFTLAFAAALLVHGGLVVWLFHLSVRPPVSNRTLIIFGTGLIWASLLALLSIRSLSGMLPSRIQWIVSTVAIEYLALAFLFDFARNPFRGSLLNLVAYLPFLFLAVAGPVLRVAALAWRWSQARRPAG